MEITKEETQHAFQESVNDPDLDVEVFEGLTKRINALIQEKLRRFTVNGFEPKHS